MEDMVGFHDWGGQQFDVVQTGSRIWSGRIIVWKKSIHSAAHGRRSEGSAPRQWATGDTIEMQICKRKTQLF